MSVFVVSRFDVGFFGFISGDKIALLPSDIENESSGALPQDPITVSCEDKFAFVHKSENDSPDEKEDPENTILCASISNCGNFIAASDTRKSFYLWRRSGVSWTGTCCRKLSRKAFKVLFTNSGTHVLLVDRAGDVFSFPVSVDSDPGKLILGHICIILDAVITKNDSYLITSDRDFKIRVSLYPNCYNIHTYCLGHDEFVSTLALFDGSACELLISGSGDGSLRVWKYQEGKELVSHDATKSSFRSSANGGHNSESMVLDIPTASPMWKGKFAIRTIRYSTVNAILAVLFHPQPCVGIYRVSNDSENMFVPVQLLNCQHTPYDAYFDHRGNLWVYRICESEYVMLFKCVKSDNINFVRVLDERSVESTVASELNKNWFHKMLPTVETDMRYLYKATADDWAERKPKNNCKKQKLLLDEIKA